MKNKKKLSLDKIKVAKLNNPRAIMGGNPVPTSVPINVQSFTCHTYTCTTITSTKTGAMGSDI
ncbi:hypothetical protein [Aquimarina sp. 2201CG14-23]|uniref:hypothetical protein n=1 Tax=Aquimarina mycalae TaxID=3040073 RepID=UPI002477D91D|nr:hypothetical protein [Aquimarina sp. 2201CG14-23]MDH7448209.1 hypothetical protein [Aquimarina sp. 2201CG14-23]